MNKLIVDDDESKRDLIIEVIQHMGVSGIVTADNGKDALAVYALNEVDLIITDIDMPVMNGIDFIKAIRKIDQDIPIIVITGNVDNPKISEIRDMVSTIIDSLDLKTLKKGIYTLYKD